MISTCLEIVTVRLSTQATDQLLESIGQALRSAAPEGVIDIAVFVDAATQHDVSIHLSATDIQKSAIGEALAAHLRTMGMVSHKLWKSPDTPGYRSGQTVAGDGESPPESPPHPKCILNKIS